MKCLIFHQFVLIPLSTSSAFFSSHQLFFSCYFYLVFWTFWLENFFSGNFLSFLMNIGIRFLPEEIFRKISRLIFLFFISFKMIESFSLFGASSYTFFWIFSFFKMFFKIFFRGKKNFFKRIVFQKCVIFRYFRFRFGLSFFDKIFLGYFFL